MKARLFWVGSVPIALTSRRCEIVVGGGGRFGSYRESRCRASLRSLVSFGLSRIKKIRSKRESRVGGRLMFSTTDCVGSYLELMGLAEARTAVRALREQMMPALATET